MPASNRRQVMESFLENESLTAGLTDAYAQRILHWCIARLETFPQHDEAAVAVYARRLAQQARTVSRIAQQIEEGAEVDRILPRLQRLTNDSAAQRRFLALLKRHLPLQEYIDALLRIAEGS